jgi:hypothetical protein
LNDREHDCESARRLGDDAGLELVAAGVTLRMTDRCGVWAGLVRSELPAPARGELLA